MDKVPAIITGADKNSLAYQDMKDSAIPMFTQLTAKAIPEHCPCEISVAIFEMLHPKVDVIKCSKLLDDSCVLHFLP